MTYVKESASRALEASTRIWDYAMRLKGEGGVGGIISDPGMGGNSFRSQAANRQRYGQFKGWLYSAINALATEGAGQSVEVYSHNGQEVRAARRALERVKGNYGLLSKQERNEIALITERNDPLVQMLEHPNPIQYRFQFVYSFISNLLLTGWSYIVVGQGEGGMEMYSIPTTWITPKHEQGPFSEFVVKDPSNAAATGETLTREQVGFAHLPNPSNPMTAVAPAASQMMAIRVDDHIQASQERFFENGIFPSVIVSVGREPHPEVPGGLRPRLTGPQRRQVHAMIRKTMGGVANYGNPAIIDGLIEKIDRLSATQNEMGWEKSEDKVKNRILSAFGLNPFILGETLPGSYAQAYVVDERTCRKINCYLDLLSTVVTNLFGEENREIIWKPCEPYDPTVELRWWEMGLKHDAVEKNELRQRIGLPPSLQENKLVTGGATIQGITQILQLMGQGFVSNETASRLIALLLGVDVEEARAIVGSEITEVSLEEDDDDDEEEELEESVEELRRAMKLLGSVRR